MPGQDPWSGIPEELRGQFALREDKGANDALRRSIQDLCDRAEEIRTATPSFKAAALQSEAEDAATALLRICTGLDPNSHHGADTPKRFVKMLREMTTPPPINWTMFPNEGMDEMVVTDGIPFHSLCEHHVIPFIGTANIGYVPRDSIAGLSKLARVVQHFSAGLQVQERLTMQIADYLEEELKPRGVAVFMRAEHLCMTIRGAQVSGAMTSTMVVRGVFAEHERTAKAEFLSHISGGKR